MKYRSRKGLKLKDSEMNKSWKTPTYQSATIQSEHFCLGRKLIIYFKSQNNLVCN